MNAPTTLGAFAAALAVVFAGAFAVGDAVGPIGTDAAAHGASHGSAGGAEATGLSSTSHGLALQLEEAELQRGARSELAFRILDAEGHPVTSYATRHEKELHLIVVRRDGSGYLHLHPVRDSAGRWSTPITLPDAGSYKVLADAAPDGQAVVLAADLAVPGTFEPRPLAGSSTTSVVDGYAVTLSGKLTAAASSNLGVSVSRNGKRVELDPYLGSYGHLVSLRVGDLAYLHTHPEGDSSRLTFDVDVPSPGSYLLYLDFKHDGVVRTATFMASAA